MATGRDANQLNRILLEGLLLREIGHLATMGGRLDSSKPCSDCRLRFVSPMFLFYTWQLWNLQIQSLNEHHGLLVGVLLDYLSYRFLAAVGKSVASGGVPVWRVLRQPFHDMNLA